MFGVYATLAMRFARLHGAPIRPHPRGIGSSAGSGGWMLLRTASLRTAVLLAVGTATALGPADLAAFQVGMTVFSTVAFALDALAIAAQALLGLRLGAGDPEGARAIMRRCVRWGLLSGVLIGIAVTASCGVLPRVFTSDPDVLAALPPILAIVGVTAPLGGFVFVLDGVLIGAGDGRYLAVSGLVNLAVFAPLALLATHAPSGWGLVALQLAFAVGYLGARAVTLGLRARTDAWLR
jgi:Na+-driven multidrug efflux pump